MTDVIPLRQRSGDPAVADHIHEGRAIAERYRSTLQNALAFHPIGHPDRPLLETEFTVVQAYIQRSYALAPPRTRIRDDVA